MASSSCFRANKRTSPLRAAVGLDVQESNAIALHLKIAAVFRSAKFGGTG
ncbi:hypothetical protein H6F74_28975 [Trichocoleus sp. FACHB-90]|nr:hypothetical protein [Trichocoleus sp. FACHB-90]MBD1930221.1 hypothetical protein [Trichocoleus sp. FACHB-90]